MSEQVYRVTLQLSVYCDNPGAMSGRVQVEETEKQ